MNIDLATIRHNSTARATRNGRPSPTWTKDENSAKSDEEAINLNLDSAENLSDDDFDSDASGFLDIVLPKSEL